MKIKYAVINGIIHSLIMLLLFKAHLVNNSFADLFILITALNFSTFITLSCFYKKTFGFFLMFTAFSSITLFLSLIAMYGLLVVGKVSQYFGQTDFFADLTLLSTHENMFDLLRLLFVYLIFAIIPSFFVLYSGDIMRPHKNKIKNMAKSSKKKKRSHR